MAGEPGRSRHGAPPGRRRASRLLGRVARPCRNDGQAVRSGRDPAPPRRAQRRRYRELLRGTVELDDLAALPRRRGDARLQPRVARCIPDGQRAVRGRGGGGGRGGRHCLDPRLSASARACDAPRPASRPADRLLPPHSVPSDRAVHADAVASRDPPRAPRSRPRRLPAATRGSELRPARTSPPGVAVQGHDAQRRRTPGQGGRVPDFDRRQGDGGACRRRGDPGPRQADPSRVG